MRSGQCIRNLKDHYNGVYALAELAETVECLQNMNNHVEEYLPQLLGGRQLAAC
jgi:hypothetical protein